MPTKVSYDFCIHAYVYYNFNERPVNISKALRLIHLKVVSCILKRTKPNEPKVNEAQSADFLFCAYLFSLGGSRTSMCAFRLTPLRTLQNERDFTVIYLCTHVKSKSPTSGWFNRNFISSTCNFRCRNLQPVQEEKFWSATRKKNTLS